MTDTRQFSNLSNQAHGYDLPAQDNGGKTGWPPGLLQDDCRGLANWLSSRPDALYQLRKLYSEVKP